MGVTIYRFLIILSCGVEEPDSRGLLDTTDQIYFRLIGNSRKFL